VLEITVRFSNEKKIVIVQRLDFANEKVETFENIWRIYIKTTPR